MQPGSIPRAVDKKGDVDLLEVLKAERAAVVDRWVDLTLQVYADDSARFMRREKDRFRNPVGHAVRQGLEALFEGLLARCPAEEMRSKLDGIVRIRAVQQLPPSRAVGFVLLLKRAVREVIGEGAAAADLFALDSRIDRLALQAFDLFVECREKIYDLRLREIRARSSALRERAKGPGRSPEKPVENRSEEPVKGGCGA